MNESVSILHLSDLHRSKKSPISNEALLASLINDIERFETETPRIQKPNIIIVTGDIIRGSASLKETEREIEEQYNEALRFLNGLVDTLVDGAKTRIAIVPGNHDIDWHISKGSMARIDDRRVFDKDGFLMSSMLEEAINTHSDIKWCWEDLSFYEVVDKEAYLDRLKPFADFYSAFYDGKRTYPLDPSKQYDVFDINDLGVSIVGFNSCYNSDHLNRAGAMHPDCIAKANLGLRELDKKGRLLLAAWHHHTSGTPYENDYMNSSFLKNFIDMDVKIGFHGHQHKTEIVRESNDVLEQKKILVFSTGTLCAGPAELPTAYNRQYNIITIQKDTEDESKLNIELHSREKTAASSFDNPVWGKGTIDSSAKSYVRLSLVHEAKVLSIDQALGEVEKLVGDKEYDAAIRELNKLDGDDPFVRKFLLKCYVELDKTESILADFRNPQNTEEAIHVLQASIEMNDKTIMRALLSSESISASDDPSVKQQKQIIEAMLNE